MPYRVEGTAVQVERNGVWITLHTHQTTSQARAHLRALYANVPDARRRRRRTPLEGILAALPASQARLARVDDRAAEAVLAAYRRAYADTSAELDALWSRTIGADKEFTTGQALMFAQQEETRRVLSDRYQELTGHSIRAVSRGYDEAIGEAYNSVEREKQLMSRQFPGLTEAATFVMPPGAAEEVGITQALNDARRIPAELRDRANAELVSAAMQGHGVDEMKRRLRPIFGSHGHRAELVARYTTIKAYNVARMHSYEDIAKVLAPYGRKVYKVWMTSIDDRTCPICLALSGTVVEINESFDLEATYGTTRPPRGWPRSNELQTPPRHARCRCSLAPWVDGWRTENDVTPDRLKQQARDLAMELGLIPRAVRGFRRGAAVAATAVGAAGAAYLTARGIRLLRDETFRGAISTFLNCATGRTGLIIRRTPGIGRVATPLGPTTFPRPTVPGQPRRGPIRRPGVRPPSRVPRTRPHSPATAPVFPMRHAPEGRIPDPDTMARMFDQGDFPTAPKARPPGTHPIPSDFPTAPTERAETRFLRGLGIAADDTAPYPLYEAHIGAQSILPLRLPTDPTRLTANAFAYSIAPDSTGVLAASGVEPKEIWTDQSGGRYLFKGRSGFSRDRIRSQRITEDAVVEDATNKLGRTLGMGNPETAVITSRDTIGDLQKMFGDVQGNLLAKIDPISRDTTYRGMLRSIAMDPVKYRRYLEDALRTRVFESWVNAIDRHIGNYVQVLDADGFPRLIGIDYSGALYNERGLYTAWNMSEAGTLFDKVLAEAADLGNTEAFDGILHSADDLILGIGNLTDGQIDAWLRNEYPGMSDDFLNNIAEGLKLRRANFTDEWGKRLSYRATEADGDKLGLYYDGVGKDHKSPGAFLGRHHVDPSRPFVTTMFENVIVAPRRTQQVAAQANDVLDQILGDFDPDLKRTTWLGRVGIGFKGGASGIKTWASDIVLSADEMVLGAPYSFSTLLHESMHGRAQSFYATKGEAARTYAMYPGWEEAIVEKSARLARPQVAHELYRRGIINNDEWRAILDKQQIATVDASSAANQWIHHTERIRQKLNMGEEEFYYGLLGVGSVRHGRVMRWADERGLADDPTIRDALNVLNRKQFEPESLDPYSHPPLPEAPIPRSRPGQTPELMQVRYPHPRYPEIPLPPPHIQDLTDEAHLEAMAAEADDHPGLYEDLSGISPEDGPHFIYEGVGGVHARALRNVTGGGRVSIRQRNPEAVLRILNDGTVRGGLAGGAGGVASVPEYRAIRYEIEERMFGYRPGDEHTAVYGYIAHPRELGTSISWDFHDQLDPYVPYGPAQYGPIRLVLRDSVKPRTTITELDTYANSMKFKEALGGRFLVPDKSLLMQPTPLLTPGYEGIMWDQGARLASREGFESRYRRLPGSLPHMGPRGLEYINHDGYIEAQIHGGVDVSEIERIIFPADITMSGPAARELQAMIRKAEKLGIEVIALPPFTRPDL